MKKIAIWMLVLGVVLLAWPVAAHEPAEGRVGRAEVRFLQGMIDHHQMALDMANDCLGKASTDEVRAICQAVIDAQTPEIQQMQAWLAEWYNIAYEPMSMLGQHSEHEDHDSAAAGEGAAMPGMGGMMGQMMPEGMEGMMGMMGQMMPDGMMMAQMHMMMAQMHMMMSQMHMMGPMMPGSMGGMMGQMMPGGMEGMPGMMGQMPGMAEETPAPEDHSAHHGGAAPGESASPEDHSQHGGAAAEGMFTDPSMTMGMMAGFNRLTGIDYDITWLESMIDHHDDALHMSERILEQAEHAELRTLAEAIIAAQTAEIEQMEALIEQLSS